MLTAVLTASCEHDSYDTGEGQYSRLHTDYVTIKVRDNYVQSITTDEDKVLSLGREMKIDVEPKDTTLRWLLYYNGTRRDEPQANNNNNNENIEIVGSNPMFLLKPIDRSEVITMKTDPVTVTSVWMASNGKYLNLRLGLKTGNSDGAAKHSVALVRSGVSGDVVYYTLYHDQADVPQYYTQEYFFTVETLEMGREEAALAGQGKKVIDLTIQTYNGTWHRQFTVHSAQFTVE